MVQCCFTSTDTVRLIRTESPRRRLSHSSWALREWSWKWPFWMHWLTLKPCMNDHESDPSECIGLHWNHVWMIMKVALLNALAYTETMYEWSWKWPFWMHWLTLKPCMNDHESDPSECIGLHWNHVWMIMKVTLLNALAYTETMYEWSWKWPFWMHWLTLKPCMNASCFCVLFEQISFYFLWMVRRLCTYDS